ncbi:MAG: hypothetical protein K0S70_616 [Microbacterium sp.]|jgi:hypothetical protein|nr:hypothetical protein [Microbacterium sp.]
MTWVPLILPFVVGTLIIFIPGMVILAFSGAPAKLWGLSPALGVGVIAGSGIVWGVFGWNWGPLAVLITTVAAAAVAWALSRRTPGITRPARLVPRYIIPLALVGGLGVLAFWRLYMSVVPGPDAIGQLQDTMFHIDVVRYILENQDGSSAHTGYMDGSANASGFYPAGWHATAALLVQLTGVSIPVAATALSAVLTVVVFPLSSITLAVTVFGASRTLVVSVGVAAQLFGAFPWRFLSWGQLYSNLMAMSLLPAVIAAIILTIRMWRGSTVGMKVLQIELLAIALAGVALAQPNTVFALGIIGYLFLLNAILTAGLTVRATALRAALLTVVLAVGWTGLYVAPFMQRTVTWVWNSFETPAQAFGEATSLGFNGGQGQFVLAAITIVGALLVLRRRPDAAWLPASAAAFGIFYILAAGSEGRIRDFLTGFWYHDSYRLAALVAMLGVPLAGLLAAHVLRIVAAAMRSRMGAKAPYVAGAIALVLAAISLASPAMAQQREWVRLSFATDDAWMLSPAERDFLGQVAETVPEDAVIANNPYDGSGLAYGLYGTDVLFPAMDGNWLGEWDPTKKEISSGLTTTDFDAEVCSAVEQLGVDYLLQLDDRWYSDGGTLPEWSGLRVSGDRAGFEPVLQDGDMALFRITGCD